MFFGCKKAGKLYWALRRKRLTKGHATRLTMLAWFTMLDSTLKTVLDYVDAGRHGDHVLVLNGSPRSGGGTCTGFSLFKHRWLGFPTRRVDKGNKTDTTMDKAWCSSFEDNQGVCATLPFGTLVRVRNGAFVAKL